MMYYTSGKVKNMADNNQDFRADWANAETRWCFWNNTTETSKDKDKFIEF